MNDHEVIAAIRANHLKANIDQFERDPKFWGRPDWKRAWLDPGGTIFGDGPYLKVPIVGGDHGGTVQRVYAPARLQRRLARLWQRPEVTEGLKDAGRGKAAAGRTRRT